jgi:hypothetical protein
VVLPIVFEVPTYFFIAIKKICGKYSLSGFENQNLGCKLALGGSFLTRVFCLHCICCESFHLHNINTTIRMLINEIRGRYEPREIFRSFPGRAFDPATRIWKGVWSFVLLKLNLSLISKALCPLKIFSFMCPFRGELSFDEVVDL